MKRMKRHKVKTEATEPSTSHNREQEAHDLAYYIHDRVELMHQVFSVLKYKELKAMAPACIRNISIDDLQELCTEELLGISSKRLCAILDGAEPPSDTESSSPSPPPEHLETISLDSISSDDEILSRASSKKKKHKHRRRDSKSKTKRRKSKDEEEGEADRSKASRAGLTVLELLELQARARAIRAQLQQEQHNKPASESVPTEPPHSSDNEVEIKEEPAEVVEISSDEEKPKIEELQKKIFQDVSPLPPATVTKRISDLIITVPQNPKQKIKLNRNKITAVVPPAEKSTSVAVPLNANDKAQSVATTKNVALNVNNDKTSENKHPEKKKEKSRKKKKTKKCVAKDDDDNDEITLQLSDTEKMDLLEDLDRKNYDSVSTDTSSDSSSDSDVPKKETSKKESHFKDENIKPDNGKDCSKNTEKIISDSDKVKPDSKDPDSSKTSKNVEESPEKVTSNIKTSLNTPKDNNIGNEDEQLDCTVQGQSSTENTDTKSDIIEINLEDEKEREIDKETVISNEKYSDSTIKEAPTVEIKDQKEIEEENGSQITECQKILSEGELSDRESSEVEAVDLKPEVVCISDEEGSNKSKKKKKKKDKKSKKEKKSKKKSDFRERADQNFYKDSVEIIDKSTQEQIENPASLKVIENSFQSDFSLKEPPVNKNEDTHTIETVDKVDLTADNTERKPIYNENIDIKFSVQNQIIKNEGKSFNIASPCNSISDADIEEVYEILELSDSSCEVECTILSKEPTTREIEALSAKIDEIDRVEVITDKEIREYERKGEERMEDIESISWKDRYLDSKKVKKVMNTANIFNALRKKNKELKKKLEESKKENVEHETQNEIIETEKEPEEPNILEGSIDHYNTLEGSTKYVNPVKELPEELPGDLKKDAKLLLKMYKKLLKYNDMNKEEPNKKKKKKKKKSKKDVEAKDSVGNEVTKIVNTDDSVQNKDIAPEIEEKSIENKDINLENREVDDTENIDLIKTKDENKIDDLAIQEECLEYKVVFENLDDIDIINKEDNLEFKD